MQLFVLFRDRPIYFIIKSDSYFPLSITKRALFLFVPLSYTKLSLFFIFQSIIVYFASSELFDDRFRLYFTLKYVLSSFILVIL